MNRGFLYIAKGPEFVKEAAVSSASLKKVAPDSHVTLITNQSLSIPSVDKVCVIQESSYSDNWHRGCLYKVRHIYDKSPYERTLFVDTDTYFLRDPTSVFSLLSHVDIAMAQAPWASVEGTVSVKGEAVDACQPYNTGVIAFRKNKTNKNFFSDWLRLYSNKLQAQTLSDKETDQKSFMETFLDSEARIYVLSNIWNLRLKSLNYVMGEVIILHGRHPDYLSLEEKINSDAKPRMSSRTKKNNLL